MSLLGDDDNTAVDMELDDGDGMADDLGRLRLVDDGTRVVVDAQLEDAQLKDA
jgi:hypothetical protein